MARDDRARLTTPELRKFGITLGLAFGVLAAIFWWRGHETAVYVLGAVAASLVLGGVGVPRALAPVERGWMAMARAISKVTTPLFMSLIYFLVLTPIGLIRRTVGSHPLRHEESPTHGYWRPRDRRTGDLERQF